MKQLRTLFSTVRLFAPLPTSSYDTSFVWRQLRCFLHINKMFSRLVLHRLVGQPQSFTNCFLVITAVVYKEKWKQFILIPLILIFSIQAILTYGAIKFFFMGTILPIEECLTASLPSTCQMPLCLTTKNVSRYCQMSPENQNLAWLKSCFNLLYLFPSPSF